LLEMSAFMAFAKDSALDKAPETATLNTSLLILGSPQAVAKHFKLGQKIRLTPGDRLSIQAMSYVSKLTKGLEAISPMTGYGGTDDDTL